ncbi:FAD-binding oxidoreductase [Micromonospora harpali]|uniref:FAD-binding oxidoreductase n=1 Tax=Micromonospora harpali TaxID=1490225 RepID=A0ABW1HK55_9ACTN
MPTRRTLLKGAAALAAAGTGIVGIGQGASAAVNNRWNSLRRNLSGKLVLPSDSNYDVAKQLHFSAFDAVQPAAIAYCTSPKDVQVCLAYAQHHGLPAVPRSGGHSFGGYSTTNGLVIDVSRLNGIQVEQNKTVVGPGAQLVDLVDTASAHGVALAGGICPTVAMGGYLQGGGVGWQTRALGLGCDSLLSAQVVLADGCVVTCSEQVRPDLFWALRGGGGGNFGIVTSYERRNSTIPRMVNFTLAWLWDSAESVLTAWQQWQRAAPRALSSRWLLGLLDAAPGAVPFLLVDGTFLGTPEDLTPHLNALASAVGTPPAYNSVQDLGFRDGMMAFFKCGDKTVDQCHRVGTNPEAMLARSGFIIQRSRFFREDIPGTGVSEILAAFDADRRAGQTRIATGFALGGAASDIPRTATAYVHRDAQFSVDWAVALSEAADTGEGRAAASVWADNAFTVTDRYSTHETYQNYVDPALTDWREAYYAENYPRLSTVKHTYDPHGFFSFAQAIS